MTETFVNMCLYRYIREQNENGYILFRGKGSNPFGTAKFINHEKNK